MTQQQPKARALIFDVLGDFVKFGNGEIRLKALVALGEQLGISATNMRVLVARMREQGWLEVRREGRESIYTLTKKTLRTLDEGRRRIFRDEPPTWSGAWTMVIYTVPESDRPTREQLRRELTWLGFGSLAPATWVSPHNLMDEVADVAATLPNAKLDVLEMRSTDVATDRSIAERCWDLESLNEAYAGFLRDLRLKLPDYRAGLLDPAEAFTARIELVHSYRYFPSHDPGLPADLQPAGWLGEQARSVFVEAHSLLEPTAREFYRAILSGGSRAKAQTARS